MAARFRQHTGEPETAADLAHAAFARLLRQLRDGRTPDDLAARLNAIVRGLILDWHRATDKRRRLVLSGLADDMEELAHVEPPSPERVAFAADLDRAVRRLPEPERQAFILTVLRGLTQEEAGVVLGVTDRTVRRRLDAALTTVRKELS